MSFPDFPGCITAGKTLDALAEDRAMKNAVAFLVHAEPETERTVRINITARAKQVEEIDHLANRAGMTRSAYVVQSSLDRSARRVSSFSGRRPKKKNARHATL